MEIIWLRVLVNLLGALMGSTAIIIMKLLPLWKEEIMAIEIIIIPTIFIIGNFIIEELIKREYDNIIIEISEDIHDLEQKYLREKMRNKK